MIIGKSVVGEGETSRHQGTGSSIHGENCNTNFEFVLPVGHIKISALCNPNFSERLSYKVIKDGT